MWLLSLLPACRPEPVVLHPRTDAVAKPTDIAEGQEEEERAHEERREREELRHRAPPGVDWRALEAANAQAGIERANERRRSATPAEALAVERGSDNQAGSSWRVVDPLTGDGVLYSGSDNGGLWRRDADATTGGGTWTPIGDVLFGGVHHLAVLPPSGGDPEVLFTTPESAFFHRSDDGGTTWTVPVGLERVWRSRAVYRSTDGSERLWVLGLEGYDGRLFVSEDRARTFRPVSGLAGTWGDLWVDRTGGTRVIVAGTDGLFESEDGVAFTRSELPDTAVDDVRIAVSEATVPPTVYLAGANRGEWRLWRREPGGAWTLLGQPEDFWWAFTASTRDPDLVVYGGVDLHVSRDGGASFRSPNTWDEYYGDPETKLHADIMAITATPGVDPTAETWHVGTHGGPYVSEDAFESSRNLALRGMRIGQYYATHTSWTDPVDLLVGSQDQGLQHGRLPAGRAADRAVFEQEVSGDYGHLVSLTEGSHERVAMVYPGFVLVRLEARPVAVNQYYDYPPGERPFWLPVLVAEPRGRNAFYFLGRSVWRYESRPEGFDYAVEQWTTSDFRLGDFEQLSGLAFDPFEPKVAWLTTTGGRMFRSEDGARTFTRSAAGLPFGDYYYGTALVAARHRPEGKVVLYVGGTGYEGSPVWRSQNGGKTFEAWSDGLPPTSVNALAELRDGTGRVLAGTDTGVWIRDADGATPWRDLSSGQSPITSYYSAEVLPDQNTVRFSTYGRGVWDFRFAEPGEGCFASRDDDGDLAYCDVDCDDDDPTRAPGLVDASCDGIDQDCVLTDGEQDPDGDGFQNCNDCGGDDATRYPGALEINCDTVDQDCDGADLCADAGGTYAGGCEGCDGTGGAAGWVLVLVAGAVRRRR